MADARPSYGTIYERVRTIGRLLQPDELHYLTEMPLRGPESELVIHLSCMAHYTPHVPLLAQKILEKAGQRALIVGGPENCCGELHKHFQEHDLEKQMAKVVMLGFRRARPRKVSHGNRLPPSRTSHRRSSRSICRRRSSRAST